MSPASGRNLKRGPGHFPDRPLPGQLGNSAIAGHRTTYGAPFFDVDDLQPGDEIVATTLSGRFTYRVTEQRIVASNEYWVVATTDPTKATLTLISCDPKYTAQKRIVIFSELVASESSPVGEPILNYGQVGIWGIALSAIAAGAYLISRKLRHDWAGALIGLLPFMVALCFFFQNVNRLLPPNL